MQTTIPALGTISWVRRLVPTTAALAFLLMFGLAQSGFAQADPPLNFGTNYFVTGDYVVAGAYNMTTNFANVNGTTYAVGTINVPDANPAIKKGNAGNPGITGVTSVPAGAQIVAAFLYWQTVEKVGVTLGGPGSGQRGFFRPVITNGPQTGYPITGVDLMSQNTVSFSNGGCTSGSTGKVVRGYRADVRGYLPVDPASGTVAANSKYELMLPSTSSTTPITLGATLVIIYRVLGPNVKLNVISVYDGVYAPGGTLLTMSQTVQGFYDADANPVSKLTHIVGQGKSKKFETVSLNGIAKNIAGPTATLPSLYPGLPPFPGWYGSWDNATWTFPYQSPLPQPPNYPANPLREDDDSATTTVVPNSSQQGCVSWGAVILSATVHDDNKDGILRKWKTDQGYTDVGTGQHVDLTGASSGQQDIFIQMDHVVDSNGDFAADASAAASAVTAAFLANNHNIHLHFTDASITTGIAGANAIPEPAVTDGSASCNGALCPYPNQPGITTWRDGFELLKDQPLNYMTEIDCENNTPPLGNSDCKRRFPPAQRNSHHYVIFGDTLGTANWGLLGGLTDPAGNVPGVVVQSGTTVTFYTSRGHGLVALDSVHGNGRVTIANAMTNPNLNGTFLVTNVNCPQNPVTHAVNDCSVDNKALGPYSFTISIGNSRMANYTLQTDPYIAVASGQAGAGSGFSDVGGPGTLVTLGQWGAFATPRAKAGTLMHELGHTLGLLHGGGDNDNCKSNYQSVMSYFFQSKLLGLDFSSQQLSTLDEAHLMRPQPITTTDTDIAFSTTRWYDTQQTTAFQAAVPPSPATITSFAITSNMVTFQAVNSFTAGTLVQITGLTIGTYLNGQVLTVTSTNGTKFTANSANFMHGNVLSTPDSGTAVNGTLVGVGTPATKHCNGSPLSINDPPTFGYKGGTTPSGTTNELDIPLSNTSLDINFDGKTPGSELPSLFSGYDDWANVDLRQVGAGDNEYFSEPGGFVPNGPGGFVPGGPGGFVPGGPGGFVPGGPGGFVPGGPGGFVPGGPGGFVPGGPGAPVEVDSATSISTTDPPGTLTASEAASARTITLSWPPSADTTEKYNIYRSSDNGVTFSFLTFVGGTTLTFQDTVTCNPNGYKYFVTAVVLNTTLSPPKDQESTPTNTAPSSGPKLTGCYTNTPPTVALNNLAFTDTSSPNTPVQGDQIQITWSLQDDDTGTSVLRTAANMAVLAIGPIPFDGQCSTLQKPPAVLGFNGTYPYHVANLSAGIGATGNGFAVNWDTTNFNAGCYFFELDTDSHQFETSAALTLLIFVSDNNPHTTTTSPVMPDGVVGSAYTTTLQEAGGTPPITWSIVNGSGSLPNGVLLVQPTVPQTSAMLSGTPTAPGIYNFSVNVMDSQGNVGTPQALTLRVADAVFGDLIVADGPPSAAPSGTLLRVTQTGTTTGTIATISTGQPNGVAVDSNTGNIYATVAPLAGVGTAGVVQVSQFGTNSSNTAFYHSVVSSGVLRNPVAVAVDTSGNIYVADNQADAIYKFNSSGTLLNPSPFAPLPLSSVMHVRTAFDTNGNLIVASDKVNGASGVIEVDQINTSTGSPTVLYNTLTNAGLTDPLTAVNASATITSFSITSNVVTFQAANNFTAGTLVQISGLSNGTYLNQQTLRVLPDGLSGTQFEANFNHPDVSSTNDSGTATSQTAAYTGTFSPPLPVGSPVAISGFTNNGNNSPVNSPFTVVSCTSTQLVVNNPNGVSETHGGTATFGIASVGGVATFSDGSIDVADSSMQTIYKITTTPSLTVAPDISTTMALCCNISGMTNPSQGTTLFVTLDQMAKVLQGVPPSTVTLILSGTPLTFPNDVNWYSKH